MFIWDILFALAIAFIVWLIFAVGFRRPGPWSGFWAFFMILFLAAWAGGLWIMPLGPTLMGVYWLPFVFMALLFALLLAAVVPEPRPRNRQEARAEREAEAALGAFFWVLMIILLFAIVAGYIFEGPPVV